MVTGHVVEGWSLDRELLALILEVVDSHRLTFVAANSDKRSNRKMEPLRFPRPDDVRNPKKPPMVSAAEVSAFFARR